MYKVVAVDIDGTLLNSKSVLTDHTKEVISQAIEKGLIFVISTGRPFISAKRYSDLIPYDILMVCFNGSLVRKSKSEEIFYENKIKRCDAIKVIDYIESKNGQYIAWTKNQLYINSLSDEMQLYINISPVKPIIIKDRNELPLDDIVKFIWLEYPDKLKEYQKDLHTNKYGWDNLNYFTSQEYFLEIVNKECDKAKGIDIICEKYGIDKKDVIAIGDGFNDLSMIKYAGLGVAMDNASDELKKEADYVTLSNDNDGVAYVIEKFFLNNNE